MLVSKKRIKEMFTNYEQEIAIKAQKGKLKGHEVQLILGDLITGNSLFDHQKTKQTKQLTNIKKLLEEGATLPSEFSKHLWKIKDQNLIELLLQKYKEITNDNKLELLLEKAVNTEDIKLIRVLLNTGVQFKMKTYEYLSIGTIHYIGNAEITNDEICNLFLSWENNNQSSDLIGVEGSNNEYHEKEDF